MKKLYCVNCSKYRKFKKPKTSCIFKNPLLLFITCSKCKCEDAKKYKEQKLLNLKNSQFYRKNITPLKRWFKKNLSQECRLENIDETINNFNEEIEQNELMSSKHQKVCTTLNYIEHFLFYLLKLLDQFLFLLFFFTRHSYRNYEFCKKIKNLCNSCKKTKHDQKDFSLLIKQFHRIV